VIPRRRFLGLFAAGALATPLAAEAQQVGKVPRIGFLQRARNENVTAFTQALQDAGYVEGRTIALETRIYGGREDELPRLAAELVALKCDAIVAAAPYAIVAAAKATGTIPIVGIDLESDPVANGWARSLGHPGGNVTGVFLDFPELGGKQIQLLKEAVPKLARVAVLWDSSIGEVQFRATETAARSAGVAVQSVGIDLPEGLETAFGRAAHQRPQGMIVLSSPKLLVLREEISRLALKHRVPTISLFTSFPQAGALMAYGPKLTDMYKRAVDYVDRILKGAGAGNLPIERPARFEFIINLKTAKALGLTIPQSLLLRADEVIQ
jgi:putative ABC transport system substrate-binding protein